VCENFEQLEVLYHLYVPKKNHFFSNIVTTSRFESCAKGKFLTRLVFRVPGDVFLDLPRPLVGVSAQ
jgi:hypothetical protein